MASVKSLLQRKLEKLLVQRFPPPATIRLEDHDGIIGVITSAQFADMEPIDRQALIGDILATHAHAARTAAGATHRRRDAG